MVAMAAGATALGLPGGLRASGAPPRLAMPPLLDATTTGRFALNAAAGSVEFPGLGRSHSWGFNGGFLGPTLRLDARGETAARVTNALEEEISVHWHGLIVPGEVDGGPHQPIAPGAEWAPVLPVDQPPATLWYHSHIHGKTGPQVYKGLAGVLQLTDGQDDARGLPSEYGVDDLTLVLQDRRFDAGGRMVYNITNHDRMMGFAGNRMLVNGQIGASAVVPAGIVRLRLLNGSNARIYTLAISDGREMHLIGTDSGLLDRPLAMPSVVLAPGERAEVLVDLSDGREVALVSGLEVNAEGGGGMGGMMGSGMMGGGAIEPLPLGGPVDPATAFTVLPLVVDSALTPRIDRLPEALDGEMPDLAGQPVARSRELVLEMAMGPRMMFSKTPFSISGAPFRMDVINQQVRLGDLERWVISGQMLMHPFHVHGVKFQVLSENGGPPRLQNRGWKDTVLVNGQAEILIPFTRPAPADLPFMYHCHILEHEDAGMMGQFTVL